MRSHSPGNQERKTVIYQAPLSEADMYLQHADTCGVVTDIPYRVEGSRIYCPQVMLHTTILLSLHVESSLNKRALHFLVAIFSPWLIVTAVITWHIFVCNHPTPCLSTCKWDNYYTKDLVQMIVHGQIKYYFKIIKLNFKKETYKAKSPLPGQMFLSLFLYCVPLTVLKICIVTELLELRQQPFSSCLLWH